MKDEGIASEPSSTPFVNRVNKVNRVRPVPTPPETTPNRPPILLSAGKIRAFTPDAGFLQTAGSRFALTNP